jgi:hypothetical protein
VYGDAGFRHFRPEFDLPMLLTFLDRFEHLGWFPPVDLEKARLLAVHDVIMHVVREEICFFEFCSKGGRGERQPWLSIFFHVSADSTLRICGIELSDQVARRRKKVLDKMKLRVDVLNDWLERQSEK